MSDEVTAAPHVMHWYVDQAGPRGVSHMFMCRDCGLEHHEYEPSPAKEGGINDTAIAQGPCIKSAGILDGTKLRSWLVGLAYHYQTLVWDSNTATDFHKAIYQSWLDAMNCVLREMVDEKYKPVQA